MKTGERLSRCHSQEHLTVRQIPRQHHGSRLLTALRFRTQGSTETAGPPGPAARNGRQRTNELRPPSAISGWFRLHGQSGGSQPGRPRRPLGGWGQESSLSQRRGAGVGSGSRGRGKSRGAGGPGCPGCVSNSPGGASWQRAPASRVRAGPGTPWKGRGRPAGLACSGGPLLGGA